MARSGEARGLADDVALFGDIILTHDQMVEGVHFLPDADAADVAWKLVARNLSDLAAKGAEPLGALLGYTLSDPQWDARFADGLAAAFDAMGGALWGGDTSRAPQIAGGTGGRVFGMTMVGRASHLPIPARNGARAGDALWLAGSIGAAHAGFVTLTQDREACGPHATGGAVNAFLRPTPLLAEGAALAPIVHAMMDVSDGLLLDTARMAAASGVSINLSRAAIPLHPAAIDADAAMRWGDDYALLFALPADIAPPVSAHRIGDISAAGGGALLLDGHAVAPDNLGWEH